MKVYTNMNERIQELAEQIYGSAHYDDFKFAELIIRECMDNLAWHGHDEAVSQLEWFKVNKLGVK